MGVRGGGGWRRPRQWLVAWAPLAAGFTLLRIYEAWLASRGALPDAYHLQWKTIAQRLDTSPLGFLAFSLTNVGTIAIEVGLFAAPLAAIWLLQSRSGRTRRRLMVIAAATLATLLLALAGASRSLLLQHRPRRRMLLAAPCGRTAHDP